MKVAEAINAMRFIVDAYDKINKKKAIVKGGKSMKFGTVIGIVVAGLVVLAAGAAAAYFFLKTKECCCDDCCCDCCCDDELFDEFPEEECGCECEEAPAEEVVE